MTGTAARPDLLVADRMSDLFIIELTVDHESNMVANATRKAKKYKHLLNDSNLKRSHRKICFVNPLMTAIVIYSKHSEEFFRMSKDLNIDNTAATYISTKLAEICIRSSYYLFLYENKGVDAQGGYSITFNTGRSMPTFGVRNFTLNQYLGSVNYNMDKN